MAGHDGSFWKNSFVLLPCYHCASLFAGKQKSHKEKSSLVLKADAFGSSVCLAGLTRVGSVILCLLRCSGAVSVLLCLIL